MATDRSRSSRVVLHPSPNEEWHPVELKLLLDTSFLLHLTSLPKREWVRMSGELGTIEMIAPIQVRAELESLTRSRSVKKAGAARAALEFSKVNLRWLPEARGSADAAVLELAVKERIPVATLDSELRKRLSAKGIRTLFRAEDGLRFE